MEVITRPFQLQFTHPFELASGVRTHTDVVYIELREEGLTGYGEACLPPYLPENVDSVLSFAKKLNPDGLSPHHGLEAVVDYITNAAPANRAAKAAFDIAFHDLYGKMHGVSISELYGLDAPKPVATSFTLGISDEAEMIKKLTNAVDYGLIKLKLGTNRDAHIIETFRKYCRKPFFADVNQGWTDPGYAFEMCQVLASHGALFVEQPMPATDPAQIVSLTARSPLPIVADEAVQVYDDIDPLIGIYAGINVKLMKCGGIAQAVRMLKHAQASGLITMMGCMAESSCSVAAATHLAPLATWADLDGPLLINNDPFRGISFEKGHVKVHSGSGTGAYLPMPS